MEEEPLYEFLFYVKSILQTKLHKLQDPFQKSWLKCLVAK